jgi:hypothetical protein
MSARIIPAGHNQYVVVARGYGFVTRSNLLTRVAAVALAARITYQKARRAA